MIAVYAPMDEYGTSLRSILDGFDCFELNEQDLDLAMLQIIEQKKTKDSCAPKQGMPFLYFIDEDSEAVFALQKKIASMGLALPVMAMKTDNNLNWSLRSLMQEVGREAAYFAKRDHISDLVHQVSRKEMAANPQFAQAVYMAYGLLKQDEAPEELLDTAIAFLEACPKEESGSQIQQQKQ